MHQMLKALSYAMEYAVNATARQVGPVSSYNILPFGDPEADDW